MPGLIRGMARTAAVVGTATATRNAVNRRQADKNAQAYANAVDSVAPQQPQTVYVEAPPPSQYYGSPTQPAQYYAPPAGAAAPPPSQEDVIAQLERLGALKAQGLLTDQEFQAQKAKLLGM
jgi:hypothetical protein